MKPKSDRKFEGLLTYAEIKDEEIMVLIFLHTTFPKGESKGRE